MMICVFSIGTANAQSTVRKTIGTPEPIPYSAEELEALRTRLLEVVDTVKDFSETLKPGDVQAVNNLSLARTQIEQYNTKQLATLRASLDPAQMNGGLQNARAILNDFKPAIQGYYAKTSQAALMIKGAQMENSTGFPTVAGPDAVCLALVGAGRPASDIIIAADAVYFAAKVLDIALNRACEQVVVAGVIVLGEGAVGGGNTSAACIISDGVLFAAEQVRDKVRACDDDFTKRSIDAAVADLAHLHTDLTDSVTNDNTNKTTIVTAISNSQGAIVDNANSNTTALTTAISNIQTAIINNANANAATLTNLMLRLQIEADLAAPDNSSPVALFMTPATTCGLSAPLNQCGLIGLVRQIVVQTISNLAGPNTSQANSSLAKGDAYKNAGNYGAAYQQYRQAYKTASK
ncbi:MAG TPA: hypothetical protein VMS31_00165 [Pyrinomonadaceae bacterium]|nr:hypothetical protein [Pyrinomonadaceae bacterium]